MGAFLLSLLFPPPLGERCTHETLPRKVREAAPFVYEIGLSRNGQIWWSGTAFALKNGIFVTNIHVLFSPYFDTREEITAATSLVVKNAEGHIFSVESLLGYHYKDLLFFKVKDFIATGLSLAPPRRRNRGPFYIMGYSQGFLTLQAQRVRGQFHDIYIHPCSRKLFGTSGGVVVNKRGEVASVIHSTPSYLAYGIKGSLLSKALDENLFDVPLQDNIFSFLSHVLEEVFLRAQEGESHAQFLSAIWLKSFNDVLFHLSNEEVNTLVRNAFATNTETLPEAAFYHGLFHMDHGPLKARSLFKTATANGDPLSFMPLGYMQYCGYGGEQNTVKALNSLRKLSSLQYAPAIKLASLIRQRERDQTESLEEFCASQTISPLY